MVPLPYPCQQSEECHHAFRTREERLEHYRTGCVVPRIEIPGAGFSMFLFKANEWSREVDLVLEGVGK